MKNARLAAFEMLYSIMQEGAYSNLTVEDYLSKVEAKDKALASCLTYGVIERRLTLDYLINKFVNGRLKPKVRVILYLGAYQLYFMDKIPSSAAVNESVKLSKEVGVSYYSKLINAVLHKIDDNRIDINSIDDLEIKYSCPRNLINMWIKAYGEKNTLTMLEAINNKPPVFAVPNTLFVDAEECLYELNSLNIEGECIGDILMLTSSFDLNSCKPFHDGLFHIEDLSSYNCASALDVKAGDTVIDVCSAPGGKAFTIAEKMNNEGTVYAMDLHPHRVNLIMQGADRLGIKNIKCVVNDATEFNGNLPPADRVLCDVPCSGFGIIRRKPEIRYKELDSLKNLPDVQYKILETSSQYLKTGGKIIYSTCTLNKRENEKVVERFLSEHSNFDLTEQKTVFPSVNGGDGFYYALMEKKYD